MKTSDLVMMSVRSLWRRKLRTALTILGVVIGASSIILMLSLGLAMEKNMEEQFAQWGDLTVIQVYSGGGDGTKLDDKSIIEIGKIANVERVIPSIYTNAYITFGKYRSNWQMQIFALEAADMEALGYKAVEGRDVQEGEEKAVVIGGNLMTQFTKIGKKVDWNNQEALPIDLTTDKFTLEVAYYDEKGRPQLDGVDGKVKAPKGIEVRVVGKLTDTDWNVAQNVFVSKSVYNQLVEEKAKYEEKLWGKQENNRGTSKSKKSYDEMRVKINHRDNVVAAVEEIKALGYTNAYSNMEYIEQAEQQANSKRMALGGIGIVSFFVAAIGIANTMMMSIYERTKEIGVMKVIGAKLVDIKRMFLVEALLIGAIGGLTGSIISYGISLGLNALGAPIAEMLGMWGATTISIIPLWLAGGAIIFSTLVGLISGYFPAKKAMNLSALSAIKTE